MTAEVSESKLDAATWTIDPAHSEVGFTVRHLMSKVRGVFAEVAGEVTTTGDDPSAASVSVAIKSDSITTHNEQRDAHLRSADFFDPEKGTELTFVSTGIRPDGDAHVITGDLTINGITRSVDLAAEFLGTGVDPFGVTRLGAEASTSINRKDFGVTFNIPLDGGKVLIGDKVDIHLAVEATKS